ncbi:MAG: hypothetical protein MOGMAGMI_00346 [Candidatus Omnitrophica bacterium]|nr:hypothetical protein [Candidatus Omnitrophota bacterium]
MKYSKDLQNLINQEFQEDLKKASNQKPAFKPSSLGSKCLRKIQYSYLRIQEDFPPPVQLKKYAILGTAVHDILSGIFRKAGVLIDYRDVNGNLVKSKYKDEIDYEFPILDPAIELSAKIDAVLNINGEVSLAEFKTATVKSFEALKEPKPEHLIQGSIYLYAFNKALKNGDYVHIKELDGIEEVKKITFLYVNKDSFEMKEFTYDNLLTPFSEAIQKIIKVKKLTNEKIVAPKTQDWCGSCPWRTKCAQDKLF